MRATLFVLALLVSVSLLGCTKTPADPGDPGPGDPTPQITVRQTINSLEYVYNNADAEDYPNLLDEDSFRFYFSEHDQNDPDDPLPAYYNYVEDVAATTSLFENEGIGAENIDLTLAIPEFDEPAEGTDTFRVEHVPYDLYVTVPADYITYHAQHTCTFELTRVDGKWLITKWWDEYTGGRAGCSDEQVEESTWGQIKYML